MAGLKLTSLLGTLLVVGLVGGSLAVLGTTLPGEVPAMAVLVLVVVVFVLLGFYGERFADGGTPYW